MINYGFAELQNRVMRTDIAYRGDIVYITG